MAITLPTETKEIDQFGYRMVFLLWFLFLFEPARLLAYYIPVLEPLKWFPTILLLVAIFHWIRSPLRKYNYKWFTFFMIINLFGTVIAFFEGNWGIARTVNRQIFQFYMLGILSFSYLCKDDRLKKLFLLYFLHVLVFAVWGIYSLKVSPINPSADPAARIIVPWHPWLDNRDGFGPLMVIGIAYCYYFLKAVESRKLKMLSLISLLFCVGGVVLSFGRGVFLAMVIVIIYIWLQSERKLGGIFLLIGAAILIYVAASIISPGSMYWETMETIQDGTSQGTGADRAILWGFAWKVFINNPIFGGGTGNFGIAILKLMTADEIIKYGYTQGRLWGRSLHCAPMTILSEYGLFGSTIVLLLIIDFIKTNIQSGRISFASMIKEGKLNAVTAGRSQGRIYYYMSFGLMASFVAFWVNGVFYEIIYTSFIWNIIVINRLIYLRASEMRSAVREL